MSGGIAPEAVERLCDAANRCDAVLVGPGMMDDEAVANLTMKLIGGCNRPAFVLDAAALPGSLDVSESLRAQAGRVVLTPHAGEMAKLLGLPRDEVIDDPEGSARRAAASFQCVVALKGAVTHIVSPQGEAWSFTDGQVGLATSGSGDTLAGIITGLLARGTTPLNAALWGVYLHGEAGNRLTRSYAPLGYLARELLFEIPRVMSEFGNRST